MTKLSTMAEAVSSLNIKMLVYSALLRVRSQRPPVEMQDGCHEWGRVRLTKLKLLLVRAPTFH